MSFAIKPRTSDIVKHQVPKHLQDKEKFILFLKYYYEWLEMDGNALDFLDHMAEISDTERSPVEYADRLISHMTKFIPKAAAIDRGLVSRYMREFLNARGSLPSYEFIMQVVFEEEMTREWMSDKTMKLSESDFDYMSIISIARNGSDGFTLSEGEYLEQPSSSARGKIKSVVKSVAYSGRVIDVVLFERNSIKGRFQTGSVCRALKHATDKTHFEVINYFSKVSEDANTIHLYADKFYYQTYSGLVLRQVGGDYRAVVSTLSSSFENQRGKNVILNITSKTGSDNGKDFYLIPPSLETSHFTKEQYIYGSVDYSVTDADITAKGSLMKSNLPLKVIDGSGEGVEPYISGLTRGPIREVEILSRGKGYLPGDVIDVSGMDSGGTGFAAEVETVDGVGAIVESTVELDDVLIRDGGFDYEVGDTFELLSTNGFSRNINTPPILVTVSSISSSPTRQLANVEIKGYGSGYSYAKAVLSINGGAPQAGFTFKTYVKQNSLSEVSATHAITKLGEPSVGSIYDIEILTSTVVPAGTAEIKINGYGASANATVSSGSISSITGLVGGWNYISPVVKVIGDGYGAVLTPVKDTNGTITSITIENGGSGYTSATLVISEKYGSGFNSATITLETATRGPITGLTITSRGEYTSLGKTQNIGSEVLRYKSTGIDGIAGQGAAFDFRFRVKTASVKSGGAFYKKIFEYSFGPGSGGRVLVETDAGIVTSVSIVSGGSGYSNSTVPITPSQSSGYVGSGSGASFDIVTTSGTITAINNVIGGSGYFPTELVISGGVGSGAVLEPVISGGQLVAVHVVDGGKDYTSNSTISFVGGTTAPTATLRIVDGIIIGVEVTSAGSAITTLTYSINSVGSTPTGTVGISGSGGVKFADPERFGGGYFDPTTEVVPLSLSVSGGGGSGARLLPILDASGNIVSVQVLSSGSGYIGSPSVSAVGGMKYGDPQPSATFTVVLFDERIQEVTVNTSASGFKLGSSVYISGDGSGATVTPIVNTGVNRITLDSVGDIGAYDPNLDILVTSTDVDKWITTVGTYAVVRVKTDNLGRVSSAELVLSGSNHITPVITVPGLYVGKQPATISLYADRKVEAYTITAAGTDYSRARGIVVGDGEGASVSLKLDKLGTVDSVAISSVGSKLTSIPTMKVVDKSNYGSISGIKITDIGYGYFNTPMLSLPEGIRTRSGVDSVPFGGASVTAISRGVGGIASVGFNEFGYGYDTAPTFTAPIVAIVDNVLGFKLGETLLVKDFPYYEKDMTSSIDAFIGDGVTNTAWVNMKTPTQLEPVQDFVLSTSDFQLEVGMFVRVVSGYSQIAGVWKVIEVLPDKFKIRIADNTSFSGSLSATGVFITSNKFGPHGTVFSLDGSRSTMTIVDATDFFGIESETGDTLIAESGVMLESEFSNAMSSELTYMGEISGSETGFIFNDRPTTLPRLGAVGNTEKRFSSGKNLLDEREVRLHDNDKYQDFAYVVRTGIHMDDFGDVLTASVHPAGFKMLGEMYMDETILLPKVTVPIKDALGNVVTLIFVLEPQSMDDMISSRKDTEWAYYRRFGWKDTSVDMYDLSFGTMDTKVGDYDLSRFPPSQRFFYGTYEAEFKEITEASESSVVHSDGVSSSGNIMTIGKVSHGYTAGDKILVIREQKTATYVQTTGPSSMVVTYVGHGLTNGVEIYFESTTGGAVPGTYAVSNVTANTFNIFPRDSVSRSGDCKFKLVDELVTVATTPSTDTFTALSVFTANTSYNAITNRVSLITENSASSGLTTHEILSCPVSGNATDSHNVVSWDSGTNSFITTPTNASLITIQVGEEDNITGEFRTINHDVIVGQTIWVRSSLGEPQLDSYPFYSWQSAVVFDKTATEIKILNPTAHASPYSGKLDVRFSLRAINSTI